MKSATSTRPASNRGRTVDRYRSQKTSLQKNEPARSGLRINRATVKSLALWLATRPLGQSRGGHRLHCSRCLWVAQQFGCCRGNASRRLFIGSFFGCQDSYLLEFKCKKVAGVLKTKRLPPMVRRTIPSDRGVSASVGKRVPGDQTGNGRTPAQKRSSNGRRPCQLLCEEWRGFHVCPCTANW